MTQYRKGRGDFSINTTSSKGTTTTLCGDKGEDHGETGDEK